VTSKTASAAPVRRSRASKRLRRELVEQLGANGALQSAAVRRAFLAELRERFLPEVAEREGLKRVYENQAIVTAKDERGIPASSSTQPSMMASMLEQLDLRPGQRVLEVGAGTGYNAALLARLVGARGRVVSVELDPATVRRARRALARAGSRATVVRGDGREGWARGAPYDRIIVTASTATVAPAWYEQLAGGGLVELPLRLRQAGEQQAIVTLRKEGDALRSQALLQGGFMPLRDAPGAPVPPPAPTLSATEFLNGRPRSLAHLSGVALRGLSAAHRRRLLSLVLSEPRRRELGVRAPRAALTLYISLEAPEDRLVGGWPWPAVISRNGAGVALLAGGPKTLTRVESKGDRGAERLLFQLVEEWKQRRRPSADALRVEVTFREGISPGVALSWDS